MITSPVPMKGFMSKVFLDTSYAIALSALYDENHTRAIELADELKAADTHFVTTRAIILEIGNALSKLRYRPGAIRLLTALEDDPKVEIVPLTEELFRRGLDLYRDRVDKEWGLVDCISFAVMEEKGLEEALTADNHFHQAGFRILL